MIKKTTFTALLRVFMVLSVLAVAAFTTNGAWAATPTAGDVSGKKPATNPQTGPQGQLCPDGISMALEPNCVVYGSAQNISKSGSSKNQGSNSNSITRTFTQSTNKNNSGSSSNTNNVNNLNSLNQPLVKLGKVPAFNLKVTPTPQPGDNKNSNLVSNTNNLSQLTTKNGSNSASSSKDPSKLTNTNNLTNLNSTNSSDSSSSSKDPSKLSTTSNLTNQNSKNGSNSTSSSKDPGKTTNTKTTDPSSSSLTSNQNSLLLAFEKLTGHKLSSAQTQKLLSESGSSSSGNGSQFIHQLENLTGKKITNTQITTLEKQGSDPSTSSTSKSDPPASSLTQQLESITGHNISTSQLDKLIVESISASLNHEGETNLLQTLENITGGEISAAEAQQVEAALGGSVDQSIGQSTSGEGSGSVNSEGEDALLQQIESITGHELSTSQLDDLIALENSSSHNSEGETKLLQEIESITGSEISGSEAQQVEDALGGDVGEGIVENNNGEGSQSVNSENESSLLQQIEDITGHEISTGQLDALIADSGSDFINSEGETQLLQELENITGGEISASEAQEVEDALGGNVGQGIVSEEENETVTEPVVIGSVIPNTGLVVTNVFGMVSSLNDVNGVSTFVIGNTTVQLSDSLKGSDTFNNGDFVSVNGGFSSANVFVGNGLVSWVKPPFVVISGTVSNLGIVNTVNETSVPGVVSFMIGNTTIRMSSSIEASDNIQNGDSIKLQGFYVNAQNQVVSNNTLDFITASIDSWTPVQ
ncbi:MAG: hypothetical protein P4L50_05265 [Anaerolineaceae bacterium]|nr:hypothetical protein [Anaerolineaceae bacterium]